MLKALGVNEIPNYMARIIKIGMDNMVGETLQYMRVYYGDRKLMKHLIPVESYPWGVTEDDPNASEFLSVIHRNKMKDGETAEEYEKRTNGGYYFKAFCMKTWLKNQAEGTDKPVLKTYTLGKIDKIQPNTHKGTETLRWQVETSQYKEFTPNS